MKQARRICGSEVGRWLQYHDSGNSSGKGGISWSAGSGLIGLDREMQIKGAKVAVLLEFQSGLWYLASLGGGRGGGGKRGRRWRELKYVGRGRN